MDNASNDVDEVALNVLLAEGVDFPTAWEASRRGSRSQPEDSHRFGTVLLLLLALVFGALVLILL